LKRQRFIAGALLAGVVILVIFAGQQIRERRETAETLVRLRAAAPALAEQARTYLTHGQTREAVEKLAFAVDLAPREVDYARLQGDALTADLQLAAAVDAYRRALDLKADDAFSQASLALLTRLLASHPDGTGLTKANFQELATLAQQQGRPEAGVFRTLAATAR